MILLSQFSKAQDYSVCCRLNQGQYIVGQREVVVIKIKITHRRPHVDEGASGCMLGRPGESEIAFPGVRAAKFEFTEEGWRYTEDYCRPRGILAIGVGFGELDEHSPSGPPDPKKIGKCSADLVAERLGLAKKPGWSQILKFVRDDDLRASGTAFDIGHIPKLFQDDQTSMSWMMAAIGAIYAGISANFGSPSGYIPGKGEWMFDAILATWLQSEFGKIRLSTDEFASRVVAEKGNYRIAQGVAEGLGIAEDPALELLLRFSTQKPSADSLFDLKGVPELMKKFGSWNFIDWTLYGITAKYAEQLSLVTTTKEEFEEKAAVDQIKFSGGVLRVATIPNCDNPQMNKFCRSKRGAGADLIIQQTSSGNVQIFANDWLAQKFYDIAAVIRYEEQLALGKLVTTSVADLRAKGYAKGAERWYFLNERVLLNGSLTTRQEPTLLTLNQIHQVVRDVLSEGFSLAKYVSRAKK